MKLFFLIKNSILYVEMPLNAFNTVVLILGLKVGNPHKSHLTICYCPIDDSHMQTETVDIPRSPRSNI